MIDKVTTQVESPATVGIRELKSHLSAYLKQVKRGETLTITEHGRPVARLTPLAETPEERLQALTATGLIAWSGNRPPRLEFDDLPPISADATGTVADLLLEDRD